MLDFQPLYRENAPFVVWQFSIPKTLFGKIPKNEDVFGKLEKA